MNLLHHIFLFRLWREDKLFFSLAIIFILATLWMVRWQREEFPVLHYGMYSLKETKSDMLVAYKVVVDSRELNHQSLFDAQRELITSPLSHIEELDSPQQLQLAKWLLRYSADMRMVNQPSIEIIRQQCVYANGLPQVLSEQQLLYYNANQR